MSGNSVLTLESSIIANNTAVGPIPMDLAVSQGTLAGAHSLVMTSTVSDPSVITVISDPKLGPLQFNGGFTRTHGLLPGSPAIGAGDRDALPAGSVNDQRGQGYPRTTNVQGMPSVDIGAVQFDEIFTDSFDQIQ
jgi:hypothetical protein